MSIATKVPQLPAVPKGVDPEVKRYLEAIKQVIEVREGTRGQALDRSVTFRDLVDAGVDITALEIAGAPTSGGGSGSGSGSGTTPGDVLPDMTVPPTPSGLRSTGGFEVIFLEWDNPRNVYANHGLAEIWRHSDQNLGDASLVGTAQGTSYVDRVEPDTTYYYWIRFMSTDDRPGAFAGPVTATSALDPGIVLAALTDDVINSDLNAFLQQSTTVGDNATEISNLQGMYAVRIDSKGYVVGFGLSVEPDPNNPSTQTSYFIIRADNFAIAPPGNDPNVDDDDYVLPFVVGKVDGQYVVAMNGATIIDASIKSASIANAQINDAHIVDLNASKIRSGTIIAGQTLTIGSDRFVLRTVGSAGQMYVRDNNGIYRVKIGLIDDDYGIQVKDISGDDIFDASSGRVKISDAFINDLWTGGFKVTVPDSTYTTAEVPFTNSFSVSGTFGGEVQTLEYDPQGVKHLSIDCSFSYRVGRSYSESYNNYPAGELIVYAELYMDGTKQIGDIILDRVEEKEGSDEPDVFYYLPKLILQGSAAFHVGIVLSEAQANMPHTFSLRAYYKDTQSRVKDNYHFGKRGILVMGTR